MDGAVKFRVYKEVRMMVKCDCGGTLYGLWYTKSVVPELVIDFKETDYWFCDECNSCYGRVIHTKVEWQKLHISNQTTNKGVNENE